MSDISANNKRIAKNTAMMTIRMVIVLGVTLYSSRILLDVLGVVDYGIYNVVAGFAAMLSFLNTSLSNGIQRFYNFELGKTGEDGAKKVFNAAFIIQIALCLLILLLTEILGVWYLNTKMVIPAERLFAANWIFQLAVITLIAHILQVPFTASVMAHERMGFYAAISVFNAVGTLGGAFLLPYLHQDNLIFYGVLILLLALLSLVAYIIYTRRSFSEIRFSRDIPKSLFKEMLGFSGWNIFGTLGQMLKDQGVNLILNFFFGPVVNAARAIAYQVNSGLQSFVSNVTIPVRPQVVQSYAQGDYQRTYNLTYTISKISCYALLVMALPVMLEIDYILGIWLGDNIPEGTALFVIVVVLNSFVLNLNAAISNVVHASGKMRKYQLAGGLISMVSVILVYIGVVVYTLPLTAFIIIFFMDIIRQIIALFILKDIDDNRLSTIKYCKQIIYPLCLVAFTSVIIPMVIHSVLSPGFMRLGIITMTSVISVCISVFLFGLSTSEKCLDVQMIMKVVHK